VVTPNHFPLVDPVLIGAGLFDDCLPGDPRYQSGCEQLPQVAVECFQARSGDARILRAKVVGGLAWGVWFGYKELGVRLCGLVLGLLMAVECFQARSGDARILRAKVVGGLAWGVWFGYKELGVRLCGLVLGLLMAGEMRR